jgi:hypothetical protein
MKFELSNRYTKDGLRTIFVCNKCSCPSFFIRETNKYRIYECRECHKENKVVRNKNEHTKE